MGRYFFGEAGVGWGFTYWCILNRRITIIFMYEYFELNREAFIFR